VSHPTPGAVRRWGSGCRVDREEVAVVTDQVLVFLSHTQGMRQYPEGESFLDGAERAVNAIEGAKAHHMEFFPASDLDPAATSVSHLRRADIFLAIIGFDYGSPLRDDPSRSFTELEFDTATELGMERWCSCSNPRRLRSNGCTPGTSPPPRTGSVASSRTRGRPWPTSTVWVISSSASPRR
jgi:hypothetical protein